MEILTLLVKNKAFEKIVAGELKVEIREITASTQNKYVVVTSDEVTIRLYDAIRFVAGNQADAPEAIVKIEQIEIEYEPDEEGYIQLYEAENGQLYIEGGEMVYSLGDILETSNI